MITKLLNEVNKKIEILNNLVQDKEYFKKLDERIEKANNYIQKQQQEIERLNNKINKAIEYIEKNSYFEGNAVKTMIYQDYSKGIIEILKGEE